MRPNESKNVDPTDLSAARGRAQGATGSPEVAASGPLAPWKPVPRDYEQLSVELIRALRGPRTLAAFSRRLGSRGGMVHNWEAKRRWPTAARTLQCAERVGVDIERALERFYGRRPEWLERVCPASRAGVVALLSDMAAGTPIVEIAKRTERSRYAVSRWLSGRAEPRLPDFLRLLDATSLRLIDFLSALADPRQLPSIAGEWERLETARSLAYEAPWSHAVLRGLELAQYRALPAHEDGVLAHALGVSGAQVRLCLQLLKAAGQVVLRGGKYVSTATAAVDTRNDPAANRRLKQWWTQVGLERMRSGEVDGVGQFSFNVFSLSATDFERVRELHLRYFREVRQIVASSTPSERVAVINLQLFDLASKPP